MANKKISELPYINGGKISGNTLVPLVTYFSAATGDTVHTYISDFQTYLISGLTGNTDVFVTGGTYSAGTITFTNNTGGTFNVTGVTFSGGSSVSGDYLPLSGGTVTGSTEFTAGLSANTISATTYLNLPINTDIFVTGGTYSAGTSTFTNNTGGTFSVSGFVTGDTYVTGLTFNTGNYNLTIGRNDGVSFTDSLSILASDLTVTGGTYDPNTGEATFTNNTGGTFIVTGFLTGFTDTYVTGGTYSNGTVTFTNTSGGTFNVSGFYTGATDVFVTGGTFSAGTITFTNNTGGTFNVTGLTTGSTSTLTGVTSVGTGITIFDSIVDGDIKINSITGDTLEKITTSLSANTIQLGINEQNLTLWPLVVNGNRLIDGSVSYVSGLTFDVSPLNYIIDGQIYNIPSSTQVTLNSGDSTFDRIDVIFADISGNTGVLEGTPSANPEKPIVDSETQVEVTFVSVPANSTTPSITTELIYDEFTGEPTEWNFLKFGNQTFRISGDSTAQSYSGSKSISVSGLTTSGGSWSNGFVLSATSLTDTNQFATLQFAIRNMSGNSNNTQIRIRFLNQTGVAISSPVYLWGSSTTGQYVNYSTSNTSSWQLISIPLWKFYLTNTNVYGVRFDYAVGSTVARHYFDKIEFVEGTASSPPSNSWTTIKGDSATTITAPNPNATLTISGGTNIGSFISGTSTVVLNLDNNINLNGLTANTISATTYQNLPTDVRVTGGTFSAGTITFTNNTGGTFNVTGLTTGSTSSVIGDYLPLSGGTVTGQTFFTSGVSISGSVETSGSQVYHKTDIFVVENQTINGSLLEATNSGVNIWSTNTYLSIDAENRQLVKSDGSTISFDWENGILTGQTNVGSSTISATTYQNLPISGLTEGNYINISGSNGNYTISVTGLTQGLSGDYLPLSGGTVTGGTVFTSGVTANTISETSYIDFTTGATNPSAFAGRLFFDSGEKALSYYDIINNTVPIAMGQQLYTRVYNNTGIQIDKGKVIAITGTTNNLPSAVLATNNYALGSARPIGVAAEDIPSGSEGLVINNGILSGITINTFSNGDTLYLSDTVPGGYVASTSSLSFSSRTNEIGYVIQTGTTTGKIYVNINNEDSNLTLTDIERNILEGNVISTGTYEYTGMTLGTGSTINISPMRGWVVQNTYSFSTLPDVTNLYYTGGTNITVTNLTTADSTYILVNSASTLVQQTTFPTPQERRENIFLGKVVHPNRSTITSINQTVDFDVSPMSALRDLWSPLKLINQDILVSANGVNMNINTSAGTLWGNGIGWVTNQLNPNSISISGTSPTTFQYRTQLGIVTGGTITSGNTTTIEPGYYDLNGVVTAVGGGSNSATNQRVYLFPTGLVRIQLGQQVYTNLAAAVAGVQTETFVEYSLNRENGILIGIISLDKNASVGNGGLVNTTYAKFNFVSKFGEILGGTGGLSTTTLQQAYDNSTTPEITTNSTLGPLSVKNGAGTADNITNVFEGVNSGGTTTSYVRADGAIYGSTISGVTISATTYQNLPDNVTGRYLPLSGGTVTGGTIFQSGLTANTISADTLTVTNNISSTNRQLYATDLTPTVDWEATQLNGLGGGVILDWTQGTIKDNGPNLSIDWLNRYLSDDNEINSIEWNIRSLRDSFSGLSMNWDLRRIFDSSGLPSISYGDRRLIKSNSFTAFDWENGILTGQTNIQSSTISATTYQNLPDNVTGRYLPLSGGTVTGNTIFTSGLTANTLNVTGNTNVRAFTGTTGYISGSGQNILTVIGSGNSTTSPLFSVQGSSGELFSVNDSLVGSLFSVNDISGLPILETFSDNTTLWGSYQAPSLNTTTRTSLTAGTNTIYSIPTSTYTGAFYEYTLISTGTTGARAGQIMSIWSGTTANFTETSTLDIGTTTGVTFTVAVSGNNAVLSSSATTAGWTVKTIIRGI